MVPRSIAGIEVIGIIGTDGDIVTYAGDHPEHGTVAITILSATASKAPGAIDEYVQECARRAEDPAEADQHIDHGVDDGIAWHMTRMRGAAPTIHPLPPPVNVARRRVFLVVLAVVIVGAAWSVLQSSDIATLSPDERSWAVDLVGDWDRSEEAEPLAMTATQSAGPLVLRGQVLDGVPNAALAVDVLRSTLAAAQSFEQIEPTDERWEIGADVVTGDGDDQLLRIVSRPCAAFVLTVESLDGPFSPEVRSEAIDLARTFRRIGAPATFEKGAETPTGFVDVVRNGVDIALPDGWMVEEDASCLTATSPDGVQSVRVRWIPGETEASHLASWEERLLEAGGSVDSEAVTNRGKQRRVARSDAAAIALYVLEDDSGVYELEMTANAATTMGTSELVVFDLVASTFEVTGTTTDPS